MYVNLATKSDYSLQEGASKVADMVKRAQALGFEALALTDRSAMFGAYDFSKLAKKAGILPIIGVQLPVAFGEGRGRKKGYLVFLAQNELGYRNLCRIMNDALRPDENGRMDGCVKPHKLADYAEGIIVLSGGEDGLLPEMLKSDKPDLALKSAKWLKGLFNDRFYIQINRTREVRNEVEAKVEAGLLELANEKRFKLVRDGEIVFRGIPVVATAEARYATPDRHDAYEILMALNATKKLDISGGTIIRQQPNEYHLRSNEEMQRLFADMPHALENTRQLAQRCAFMVTDRKPILPPFESESGRSEIEELRAQSLEGLEQRLERVENLTAERRKEYFDRLTYELDIIEGMGFPGYFLIVSDFIKWAKLKDIPVGPGRGSGAGSMVAWALLITDLDPFEYGLLFERFLNPERVSMPDFDIDICMVRRDEVIQYVADKYGRENVSQIITFGEVKTKNALKDTGRILVDANHGGYGFGETNELCKLVPNEDGSAQPMKLAAAMENAPDFRDAIRKSAKLTTLFEQACKIEGLYKTTGSHAAGVIIGDRPLDELIPISWDDKGKPVTQYNMKGSENVGLVKFDFLGLKTLSVIKLTVDMIKEGIGKEIDISAIPTDDAAVYEMLAEGYSNGVFQFESAGMQKVLKQVRPTRIEDLIAVNALYRPGPMDQIDHYAACKNGTAEPHYPAPVERTKPFLEETFGIMVYQEQVMRVAQEFAGYSLGGADLLRRAMGKKIASEMDAQRKTFVDGGVERGSTAAEANQLFGTIEKFAGYGFNKSHAAAYAYIAYQTAWLKRHYPAQFFASLMSFETHKPERMALIRDDMTYFDIEMLPPSINRSNPLFAPEKSNGSKGGWGIRFGLTAIKGISGEMEGFVRERAKGPFRDLKDFVRRNDKFVDKNQLTKLVEAGAFDEFDRNRRRTLALLDFHAKGQGPKGQASMFEEIIDETIPPELLEQKEWGNKLDREFTSVGFYFGTHPIDHHLPKLRRKKVIPIAEHKLEMEAQRKAEKHNCRICVMVDGVFQKTSRFGKQYLQVKLSEKHHAFTAPFFGTRDLSVIEAAERFRAAQVNRLPIIISGAIVLQDDGQNIDVKIFDMFDIESFLADVRGDLHITVDVKEIQDLPETAQMKIKASDDLQRGAISRAQYEKIMRDAMVQKIQDRVKTLRAYLSDIRINDENDPEAIKIRLALYDGELPLEQKALAGKYLVSAAVEGRIKAMDGVTSVQEIASKAPAPEAKKEMREEAAEAANIHAGGSGVGVRRRRSLSGAPSASTAPAPSNRDDAEDQPESNAHLAQDGVGVRRRRSLSAPATPATAPATPVAAPTPRAAQPSAENTEDQPESNAHLAQDGVGVRRRRTVSAVTPAPATPAPTPAAAPEAPASTTNRLTGGLRRRRVVAPSAPAPTTEQAPTEAKASPAPAETQAAPKPEAAPRPSALMRRRRVVPPSAPDQEN